MGAPDTEDKAQQQVSANSSEAEVISHRVVPQKDCHEFDNKEFVSYLDAGSTAPPHPPLVKLLAPHCIHRIGIIGDGRCSVDSLLVALKKRQAYKLKYTEDGTLINPRTPDLAAEIDDERLRLFASVDSNWTERDWQEKIPAEVRTSLCLNGSSLSSWQHFQATWQDISPTTHLGHDLFYMASDSFDIGIIILVAHERTHPTDNPDGNPLVHFCTRIIAPEKAKTIIIYQRKSVNGVGHYEPIQDETGTTIFPSAHSLVQD